MTRLWPDTLVGRAIIVVLIGVVVSNLVALGLFESERLGLVTGDRIRLVAERISAVVNTLEETPRHERRWVIQTLRSPGLRLAWSRDPWVKSEKSDWRVRVLRRAIEEEITIDDDRRLHLRDIREGEASRWLNERRSRAEPEPNKHHSDHLPPTPLPVELLAGSVELSDGTWLNFAAFLPPLQPVWASRFALIALLTTATAVAASVWAVRRAAKPLSILATAAERLGMDVDAPPMAVQGPREVRTAALAFNNMQGRLQRFVKDRTQMLAAISHDLRTPLTRMRLRAELVENAEDRDKMIADISDMEAMIAAALSFLRDEVTQEPRKPVDLAALIESVCDDAREAGAEVSYEGPDHIPFLGRVLALKRAFTNIIDNAVTYGGCARLFTTVNADTVTVWIDDDGPGVPEADMERVFEPFTRLDESRNRETGGMGLGLAVVRSVIRSHGGDIALANRPEGGLRVTVSLPTGRDGADHFQMGLPDPGRL